MTKSDIRINTVISVLPKSLQSYAILSRIDRPIGYILLWIPIVWGAVASRSVVDTSYADILYICTITLVGAIVMRGAGCTWNDIADRDFDKKVARTATRPIASGQISIKSALFYLILQLFIGLIVLLALPMPAQIAGLIALIPAGLYPFMKRFTYWPQAWLGLTFNWGIWVGWLSFSSDALHIPLILHIASIFWTLGYDTIYAHQDREDDLMAGVKSTALKLGIYTKPALFIFYSVFCILFTWSALLGQFNTEFYFIFSTVICSFIYQIYALNINDTTVCLHLFKHNFITGILIALSILIGVV